MTPPKTASAAPERRFPDVRAKYFPASPQVTADIDAWARASGARILAVIPVYWEGATDA